MALVAGSLSDGAVLTLVEGFLRQDIMIDMARWRPVLAKAATGTPQGAVISPLLANLYLHPPDVLMAESGWRMVRYADDFVILCRTQAEALAALRQVEVWVAANGLTLHPDKTRVGDSRQSGQGSISWTTGLKRVAGWCARRASKALNDKVRSMTRRSRGDSLARIIEDLNPMLRGWFGYFQHATPALFGVIEGLSAAGCAPFGAGRKSAPVVDGAKSTISAGPTLSSPLTGYSPCNRPRSKRDPPDEETDDWRAVCGRTARPVRRAGRPNPSRPLSREIPACRKLASIHSQPLGGDGDVPQ